MQSNSGDSDWLSCLPKKGDPTRCDCVTQQDASVISLRHKTQTGFIQTNKRANVLIEISSCLHHFESGRIGAMSYRCIFLRRKNAEQATRQFTGNSVTGVSNNKAQSWSGVKNRALKRMNACVALESSFIVC
jgi:hypothetical protein